MEKRKSKRHSRRLKVKFGEKGAGFPHSGLTNDVSATGIFVVTSQRPRPGTRLHLEVTLPGELPLFVEGVVMRQVLVPPELRQVVRAGFGIRYLVGAEFMAELVPAITTPVKEDPFLLAYSDEAEWRGAVENEFNRGGLFLWTKNPVPQNLIVTVTFDLVFLRRQLAFEARVVHTNQGADGRYGVAMMFVDAPGAMASLSSTLGQ
jgi:hypothetical protein